MDFSNVKDRLTAKLGPLPVWAWALIAVGVGYAAYRIFYKPESNEGPSYAVDAEYADNPPSDDSGGLSSAYSTVPSSTTAGLSSGSGGVSLVPGAMPDDSSTIGLASWSADNPLPVIISQINPNLYDASTTGDVAAQAPVSNPSAADAAASIRSGLLAAVNAAKDVERAAQARVVAAKSAVETARNKVSSAKTDAQKRSAKSALAAAESALVSAQAEKARAAAASGAASARLASA